MKKWKIILEFEERTMEISIEASSYSNAFIESEKKYPGCVVKSISEIRKPSTEPKD
jgi:hypothetical protein